MSEGRLLVCWHSERAGVEVVTNTVGALRNKRLGPDRILYLVQGGRPRSLPDEILGTRLEALALRIDDPTRHRVVYEAVLRDVCPRLRGEVHVNVSPGTPAMHAVWLVLHAGGALPAGTRLWSSQWNPETKRTRLDAVEFVVTTYLAEVRRRAGAQPDVAAYETEARSPARRAALERLARYARVIGAPLLILGERGTGKTRLVETHVSPLKQRPKVVSLACGGLDSTLAESLLFGHKRGAFTGAASDRPGLLAEADGGVLFLDEVQDLPAAAQRKLVRVLQDRNRRYRPLGGDRERSADIEVVCASNLELEALQTRLDADLFDRISHLTVRVPPLRECREDVRDDWSRVWRELRRDAALPERAPWSDDVERALAVDTLPGNLRDLQRLALLVAAWNGDGGAQLASALEEWQAARSSVAPGDDLGTGTRRDRVRGFQARLARWAKDRFGTWGAAAKALDCDEKTLRQDAGER
ncbi:MAG: sigma 54-interacting transcriptional regulator [Polyangiaceae bacterium]|nr:sigma 54-interacting transcriptional regulator [Polyangiaceae bacterium]